VPVKEPDRATRCTSKDEDDARAKQSTPDGERRREEKENRGRMGKRGGGGAFAEGASACTMHVAR